MTNELEQETPPIPSLDEQYKNTRDDLAKLNENYSLGQADIESHVKSIQEEIAAIKEPSEPGTTSVPRPKLELNKRFIIASSVLMGAAILGGAYLGVNSQGAMLGLTSAINGLMNGRKDEYDRQMSEYNSHVAQMNQKFKVMTARHDAIIKQKDKSLTEKLNELKLAEASYGRRSHDLTLSLNGISKLNEARKQMLVRLKDHAETIENKHTSKELDYIAIVGQLAKNSDISFEEAKKRYPAYRFYDDVQNMRIGRSVEKAFGKKEVALPKEALDAARKQHGDNYTGIVEFENGQRWEFKNGKPVKKI